MPDQRFAGHPIHFRQWGGSPAEALLLHCSLAHSGAWSGVAGFLSGSSLFAPDLPGHGRSGDWDGREDIHGLTARVVTALAAAQSAPDGLHLIGHSFGATVALRVALERPELVRSLVLIEPVLFAAARAAEGPAFAQYMTDRAAFIAALHSGDRDAATRLFHAEWGTGQPYEAMADAHRSYLRDRIGLIPAIDDVVFNDAAGMLTYMRLESLGVPVLLISGTQSPPVIGEIQAELARRLPQVRHLHVAGAGHMVPITHPGPVAEAIAAHLAAV